MDQKTKAEHVFNNLIAKQGLFIKRTDFTERQKTTALHLIVLFFAKCFHLLILFFLRKELEAARVHTQVKVFLKICKGKDTQ